MNKKPLSVLAQEYALDPKRVRTFVALALTSPVLDDYIEHHKDGWVGIDGQFARVLARVSEALK